MLPLFRRKTLHSLAVDLLEDLINKGGVAIRLLFPTGLDTKGGQLDFAFLITHEQIGGTDVRREANLRSPVAFGHVRESGSRQEEGGEDRRIKGDDEKIETPPNPCIWWGWSRGDEKGNSYQ